MRSFAPVTIGVDIVSCSLSDEITANLTLFVVHNIGRGGKIKDIYFDDPATQYSF